MQTSLNARGAAPNQKNTGNFVQMLKPLPMTSDVEIQWKAWIQRYEWFEKASCITAKDDEMQVSTFMTAIGADWFEIYNMFKPNEKVTVLAIKTKFLPKSNTAFETLVFNNIKQDTNELFDDFLVRIQTRIKKCEFGQLEDRLLRDKIIIAVSSDELRKHLISDADINLEKRSLSLGQAK